MRSVRLAGRVNPTAFTTSFLDLPAMFSAISARALLLPALLGPTITMMSPLWVTIRDPSLNVIPVRLMFGVLMGEEGIVYNGGALRVDQTFSLGERYCV